MRIANGVARTAIGLGTLTMAMAGPGVPAVAGAEARYADLTACGAPPASGAPMTVAVGVVACQRIDSEAIGATNAFGYFVPPRCAPATGRRCPVVLLLHGGGGDRTSLLGTTEDPDPLVLAVDRVPPVDPRRDPAGAEDTSAWVPAAPIDAILVAPQARTLPGGHGPFAGADGGWIDWNPRYARGGDAQAYDTPAPRFERHVVDEVLPFVEHNFPVAGGRSSTSVLGCSVGGYGATYLGLAHPDRFDRFVAVSMVGDPRLVAFGPPSRPRADGAAPTGELPGGVRPLAPGVAGQAAEPAGTLDVPFATYAGTAAYALGDPVADHATFAAHAPAALSINALARAGGRQVLTVVRTVSDGIAPTPSAPGASTLAEQLAVAEAPFLTRAFDGVGATHSFERLRGTHCRTTPYARLLLEAATSGLRGSRNDGARRSRRTTPERFDYATGDDHFSIWEWKVGVRRPRPDVLRMWDVTCSSLRLQGRGTVTVVVPQACHTGRDGRRTFTAALEARAGTSMTRTVLLSPLRDCASHRSSSCRTP